MTVNFTVDDLQHKDYTTKDDHVTSKWWFQKETSSSRGGTPIVRFHVRKLWGYSGVEIHHQPNQLPIPQSWMICVGKAPGKSHSCHYASRKLQSSIFSLWWTCVLSIQVPLMTFKHSNEKPPFEPCDLLVVFGRLSCQKNEKQFLLLPCVFSCIPTPSS